MSKEHWSDYWHTGVLTSLPADFKANYDGEVAEFWESILARQGDSCRVLDVCTGNGAVVILLAELADQMGKSFTFHAVDASDINPVSVARKFPQKEKYINSIHFTGNCLVEEMSSQFNEQFDLIVSQYGIEYCETKKAAENIDSLLKPGGKFTFIAHSPNTAMLEYMSIELAVYQCLDELDVFGHFIQFSTNNITVNGFKIKLEAALNQLSQMHQFKQHTLFNSWGQIMYQLFQMSNRELKAQRQNVGDFVVKHIHAKARAKDMLNVSKKLINNPNWYKSFEDVGLSMVKEGEITYKGKHNVGHYYDFIKEQ